MESELTYLRRFHQVRPKFHLRDPQFGLLLVLPAAILLFGLMIAPLVYSSSLSLLRWNLTDPIAGRSFVGLSNFVDAFRNPSFENSLKVTTTYCVGSVSVELTFGLLLALILNSRRNSATAILRTLLLAPAMLTPIVAGIVWRWIYAGDYGVLNYMLRAWLGVQSPPMWLARPETAMIALIIVDAWVNTPFCMLILLAGLQMIPDELYEAAATDGASAMRSFFGITLPLLKRAIAIVLLIRSMDAFRVFDSIFALTMGGPANSTETVVFYTYKVGFRYWHMGLGAAMSTIIFFTIFILSLVYIRVLHE
jgi:ABC-type sugar transport system permease subunit